MEDRDYNHSRLLDVHRWSNHPEVNFFVDSLYNKYFKNNSANHKIQKKHLKLVLLDLYVAWNDDPNLNIAVHMHEGAYSNGTIFNKGKSRYNELNIKVTTIKIVHILRELGFIGFKGGYEGSAQYAPRVSRIWATDKLIKLFKEAAFSYFDINYSEGREVVILRDADKRDIEYEDNNSIKEMRELLHQYNELLRKTFIDIQELETPRIKLKDDKLRKKRNKPTYVNISHHDKFTRRIFNNGSFEEGGRFYGGWWQTIPSPYRALITIDGSRTNEFDFGKLHPTMMYAEANATCEGDAYDIGIDTKHRDTIKELFNAMVQIQEFTDNPPRIKFSQTGKTWKQFRDMILKRHEPIKHMFFCGMGNNLQYRDSIIAEQVMLHFAKNDIPVLPVHDSFIITAGLFIDLLEVMEKDFKKHIGVPIDIRSAEKSVRVRTRDNEDLVGYILNEMEEFSDWTARNPL